MCLWLSQGIVTLFLTYVVWFNWTVIGELLSIVQGNRTPLPLPPLMFLDNFNNLQCYRNNSFISCWGLCYW